MARIALSLPQARPAPVRPLPIPSPQLGPGPRTRAITTVSEFVSGWLGLTLLLAAAALSLYLVQISSMATAGYELQRLEAERDGWLARNEQLAFELSKRRSLAWVEAQAVEKLAMVRPDKSAPVLDMTRPAAAPPSTRGGVRPDPAAESPAVQARRPRPAETGRPTPGDLTVAVDALKNWLVQVSSR
jgi:hypothetical protein